MNSESKIAHCPSGLRGLPPIVIDLDAVSQLEKRLAEVAYVSLSTGPALLAYFNEYYLNISKVIHLLSMELINASTELSRIWGEAYLFRAPRLIESKGLGSKQSPFGTDPQKQAAAEIDQDYLQAVRTEKEIKTWIEYLKEVRSRADHGYQSVKKIMGDTPNSGVGDRDLGQPNLPEKATAGSVVIPNGFGTYSTFGR